jgi:hypothetical protein
MIVNNTLRENMQIHNIFTHEPSSLPSGKADFLFITNLLSHANEAEFITLQNSACLAELSKTSEDAPSFTLITRAIENLNPFSSIEILNLNDKEDAFSQGMSFGRRYELKGNYLILSIDATSESLLALDEAFMSDTTLLFCAGFLLEATRRFHVVVAGALEAALCLLLADRLREKVLMRLKSDNLTLATTHWAQKGKNAKLKHILEQLSYLPHAIYTEFSLVNSEIEELKKYENANLKDAFGAGAALAYGKTNGLSEEEILNELELVYYML